MVYVSLSFTVIINSFNICLFILAMHMYSLYSFVCTQDGVPDRMGSQAFMQNYILPVQRF